jgi:hypothetical protein
VAAVQAGLKRRGEFAQNVALTRDGKHAATSNLDGYITIRDRETLEPELSFQLDEQSLRLGFIVNDRFLTVTTPSGTVALIEWRRQELVEAACAKLSRQTLTPAESRRYFGDQPADDGCRKVPYAARYAPAVVARLESQIEAEQARRLRDMQRAYDAAIPFNPPQPPVQAVISQPELPSPTGLPTLEQLKSLPTASLGVETKQTVLRVLAGAGDFAAAFAVLETIPVGGDERASWLITLTGMMVRSGAKDVEPLIAHAKQEFAKLSPESLPRWVAVARSNGDAGVLIPERLAATLQPVTLTPRDELFEVSEAAAGHARLKERAAANAEALRAIEVAKKLTWFDPGDLHAVTDAATEIARGAVEGSDRDLLSHAVALLDVIRPETLRYPPSLSPHPPSLGFDAIARGLASIALEAAEGGWSEDARRLLKAAAEKAASIRTPIERAVMYSELTRTALRLGNAAAAAEYAESAATAAKAVGETINDYVKQEALTEAAGALSAVGLATDDESKLARAEDLITAAVQVAQFGGSRQFGAVTVGVTIGVATSSQRDVNRLVALLERGTKDEVEVLRNLRTAIEQLDRKSDQPFRAEVIEVAVQRTLAAKNNTARSDSAIALLWYASSREQIIQLVAAVHDVGFDARAKALSYGIMAAERLGITPPARD